MSRRPGWAALLLALAAAARPAAALEFTVSNAGGRRVLVASGAFEQGDSDRLDTALQRSRGLEMVVFRSPGGNAVEGMKVGRVIRRSGLATHLPGGMECASACTYAFLGGVVRTAEPTARYGVHMFTATSNDALMQSVTAAIRKGGAAAAAEVVGIIEQNSASFAAQLAYYSIEMGVSPRLLDPNFATSHADIRWLNPAELRRYNVVNAD